MDMALLILLQPYFIACTDKHGVDPIHGVMLVLNSPSACAPPAGSACLSASIEKP